MDISESLSPLGPWGDDFRHSGKCKYMEVDDIQLTESQGLVCLEMVGKCETEWELQSHGKSSSVHCKDTASHSVLGK